MAGRRQSGGPEELKRFIQQNQLTPRIQRRVDKQKAPSEPSGSGTGLIEIESEELETYQFKLEKTSTFPVWIYDGPKLTKTQWDILASLIKSHLLLAQIHCVYYQNQIPENVYKTILRTVVKVSL